MNLFGDGLGRVAHGADQLAFQQRLHQRMRHEGGGGGGSRDNGLHNNSFLAFSALAVLVATLIFFLRGFVSLNLYVPIIANRVSNFLGYP